jgi:hypothetical protein
MLWGLMSFAQPQIPLLDSQPGRVVTRYTLVSSLGNGLHDPTAWRLLGSNDKGNTWRVLDTKTNQVWDSRSQRMTRLIEHPRPYNTYRLQIDAGPSLDDGLDRSVHKAPLSPSNCRPGGQTTEQPLQKMVGALRTLFLALSDKRFGGFLS